jgi:hypothetical protein
VVPPVTVPDPGGSPPFAPQFSNSAADRATTAALFIIEAATDLLPCADRAHLANCGEMLGLVTLSEEIVRGNMPHILVLQKCIFKAEFRIRSLPSPSVRGNMG